MPYTRGPWAVEDIGANCFLITGQVDQSGTSGAERSYYNRIASVTQRDPHPVHQGGIDRATALANAHMFASAPELVEELQLLLDEFKDLFITVAGERPFDGVMDEYKKHPRVVAAHALLSRAMRS